MTNMMMMMMMIVSVKYIIEYRHISSFKIL
jgi:hypothetical protein